jgi:hypothetical protein
VTAPPLTIETSDVERALATLEVVLSEVVICITC